MEFKTAAGGDTTLVFDLHEEHAIGDLSLRLKMPAADIKALLTKQRQANPLAGFTELIGLTFSHGSTTAGVAPAKPKPKTSTRMDPLLVLENGIRLKLNQASGSPNATSQMQIVEATLLQALATCLLAQTMRDLNA
jgi:hypothetical protein